MEVLCQLGVHRYFLNLICVFSFGCAEVFTAARLSTAVASGGCSGCGVWAPHGAWLCSCGEWRLLWAPVRPVCSSWRWPLLLWSVGLGVWAQWSQLSGSRAHAQRLWHMSFVALWHEDLPGLGTEHVFCIGKPILSH